MHAGVVQLRLTKSPGLGIGNSLGAESCAHEHGRGQRKSEPTCKGLLCEQHPFSPHSETCRPSLQTRSNGLAREVDTRQAQLMLIGRYFAAYDLSNGYITLGIEPAAERPA